MSVKIKTTFNEYPYIYEVRNVPKGRVVVVGSPFANCQSFSMGDINAITYWEDREVKEMLRLVDLEINKRLLTIDIRLSEKDEIMNKLNKYCKIISEAHYKSTNNDKDMVIIQLLLDKNSF